jgi:histidinol-phosphate aminotransferase
MRMVKDRSKIVKEVIEESKRIESYNPGETIKSLACKLNKRPEEFLKINSNENLFVPIDFLKRILKEVVEEVDPRVYPKDEIIELRESVGQRFKVPSESVVIGAGSDQLIDLIIRMVVRANEEVLSIAPTFAMYKFCTLMQRAKYRAVNLMEDFSLNLEEMLASATPKTRVLFLCSPNNPTANQFNLKDIRSLAESFSGLIVVDEAYADFSDSSVLSIFQDFENMIILRTFSKVFGLAGLRLGFAVASPELAKVMNEKFQTPFPVTSIAAKACLKILGESEVIESAIKKVKVERKRLIENLNLIDGVNAFNSETNFVLYQTEKSSDKVFQELLKRGIIVRKIGRVLHLENCLRVTVAPPPMIDYFLSSLREVLEENGI